MTFENVGNRTPMSDGHLKFVGCLKGLVAQEKG